MTNAPSLSYQMNKRNIERICLPVKAKCCCIVVVVAATVAVAILTEPNRLMTFSCRRKNKICCACKKKTKTKCA